MEIFNWISQINAKIYNISNKASFKVPILLSIVVKLEMYFFTLEEKEGEHFQ